MQGGQILRICTTFFNSLLVVVIIWNIICICKMFFFVSFFSDMTYDQVWWPILGIYALHLTHPCTHTQQWTHTHHEHTPGAVGSHLCCSARGAVGGSVPCSRAPQSWYWGWREHWTFTPLTNNSCRPETRTHNILITSDSLTIRPQIPQNCNNQYRYLEWWLI